MKILLEEKSIYHLKFSKYSPSIPTSIIDTPVIMVHGMFGGQWYFKNWAIYLAEKGLTVYVPNLRGHNGSHEDVNSVMSYVYDLSVVVDYIGKPCVLIGHSMGGLVVQKYSEIYANTKGLILVASAPAKGISVLSLLVIRKMVKKFYPMLFNKPFQINYKDCFELVLNNFPKNDPEAIAAAIKFSTTPESGKAARELAFSLIPVNERKINCPVLIVAGSMDKMCPLNSQLKIKKKYYFSDYLQFKRGHMLMLEEGWKEVISKIYNWIDLNFIY